MARKITTVQKPRTPGLVDDRFDVLVNGVKVGNLCKNKHRMWIGDFDLQANDNDYPRYRTPEGVAHVAHRLTHAVAPSRRKAEVVAAIVEGKVGAYLKHLEDERVKWDAIHAARKAQDAAMDALLAAS